MLSFPRADASLQSDSEIVASIRKGNRNAYALLVKRYQSKIYSIFIRSLRSEALAAELAQDVFLRAFEKLDQYAADKKFSTWLNAIAVNRLRDYWRKEGATASQTEELDIELIDSSIGTEEQVERRTIMQAIHKLPCLYKEALLLRYRDDYSIPEVAESLGIGTSAAKMRLKRGVEAIALLVEDHHD
ncbi:RNA polymerase sigma factor [Halodesulfovibrio spirochaetisodalis]|uniref:RNA polymerase sigma factor n=1 Tax=Halodesulfovibrio spirochaetisodalis TaxID=1560234 RepID=UPI000835A41A|nr:sigma-70 family RNA polymerase sigma factor [Halodesulfovibrio spirochaetisodalis]